MYFFSHKAQIKKDQGLTDEEKPETTDKKRKSGKRKKRHRKKKQVNSHDTPVTVCKSSCLNYQLKYSCCWFDNLTQVKTYSVNNYSYS